ncbi:MAG: long-chain fatty acid--CoA ligase [Bacteroidales bacterium]|nr:long-chain fatty acid--CoA ligase [Bacteroidales bacterium]
MTIKRTFDFIDYALENHPKDDAFSVKRNGKWEKYSTDFIKRQADLFSYGLIELGFKKGEKLATVSNNRPEWNIIDIGMEQIGVVHVPVYPTIGETEYEHVLSHSDSKMLIISSKERYDFINPIANKIKEIQKVYTIDETDGIPSLKEIIELGEKNKEKHAGTLTKMRNAVKENDLSSIIYTSGTTGLSKGVMMTHKNFVSNVIESEVAVPKDAETTLSFLPLNHVFERMLNYLYTYMGISIYYAESMETIVPNIQEIKPHMFAAVPRIFEKVYDSIYNKGLELSGIKKSLFFWALKLGQKYDETKDQGAIYNAKLKLANKLIFVKWREALGGNIKAVVSGGAALQPRLARVFGAAGIPVLEGYGLSETAPVIAVNRLGEVQAGTVGELLKSCEVKIANDGEILFKGPNLMPGYYKDEAKTKEAIDADGWFHTGDTGELNGRILKITGRTKEIFKLSTGKYVAPELVENKIKESPFIEQLMVVGDAEKYTAAIVCPAFEHLHNWASRHNISFKENIDLITNKEVIEKYEEEIEKKNYKLDNAMQIKKFSLVCEEWTPETGELSPTLKLKRRILVKNYKIKLDYLYGYSDDEGFLAK